MRCGFPGAINTIMEFILGSICGKFALVRSARPQSIEPVVGGAALVSDAGVRGQECSQHRGIVGEN